MKIRFIQKKDDLRLAEIIRKNLEDFHLNLPGTIYFDPELNQLSTYYSAKPEKRGYFVLEDVDGTVVGGIGIDEFSGFDACAEIQKLYLSEEVKGQGLGKYLVEFIENYARKAGYKKLYLETHTNLEVAIHIYQKLGFLEIEKPKEVQHSTMNLFYLKEI